MSKKDKKKQQQHQQHKPTARKTTPAKKTQAKPPQWLWIAGGIVLLALIIFGAWSLSRAQSAAVKSKGPEISIEEAYAKYKAGVFLLDVRTQEEWDEFHAPFYHPHPTG